MTSNREKWSTIHNLLSNSPISTTAEFKDKPLVLRIVIANETFGGIYIRLRSTPNLNLHSNCVIGNELFILGLI